MKKKTKLQKTHKFIASFVLKTINNYKCMRKTLRTIWQTTLCALFLTSCGSTKVQVTKPQNGTYTQIVVTTNNPISTEVNADANVGLNGKEKQQ